MVYSIPRDSLAEMADDHGGNIQKINAAYEIGKAKMAKKTVIKQALKYAPLKTDFHRVLSTDETIKNQISSDMSEIANEIVYENPEE